MDHVFLLPLTTFAGTRGSPIRSSQDLDSPEPGPGCGWRQELWSQREIWGDVPAPKTSAPRALLLFALSLVFPKVGPGLKVPQMILEERVLALGNVGEHFVGYLSPESGCTLIH